MKIVMILSVSAIIIFSGCKSKHEKLEEQLTEITAAEFNGIIYNSVGENVYFNKSISTLSKQIETPEADTPIYLASLTKLFTELVTLKLAEMNMINLDSSISVYVKNFKPAFGKIITIRHLLKMQSGLPRELSESGNMPGVEYDEDGYAGSFLNKIPDFSLQFEPGTRESYSNLNYWILGAVIEKVTGKNIEEAFNFHLFQPLGMISSGLFRNDKDLIQGYKYENDQLVSDTTDYSLRYTSGGCYTTLNDLLKVAETINEKRFLSDEYQELLYSTGSRKIEVYGSLPGFTNMFICEPDLDFTLIVLNNIGLRNLETMTMIKSTVEEVFDKNTSVSRPKRKVALDPIDSLDLSINLEKGLSEWIKAVEVGNKENIFSVLNKYSVKNTFDRDDQTWSEIVRIRNQYPNFRAAGYRCIKNEVPPGLEVWFITDESAKIAFLWIPDETNPDKVAGFMVKPDDMEWMGESF